MNENFTEKKEYILNGKQNAIYNLPNMGIQLIFALLTNFVIIFYVNVMDQPPLYIGVINSLFLVFGAFLNPIWGAVADRIRTKLGRKKTLVLLSAPVIAVAQILIWSPPIIFNEGLLYNLTILIWFGSSYFIYVIGTSAFQTSYLAMIPEISTQEQNRLKISILNMITMVIGAAIGIFVPILILQNATKNLSKNQSNLSIGTHQGRLIYDWIGFTSIFVAAFFIITVLLMNWKIKEPEMEIKGNNSIKSAIKNVIEPYKDRNFGNYLVSYFLLFVIITIFQMLILNYSTFVLGLRGDDFLIFAVIAFVAATISFFFFQWLSEKYNLKRSMEICLILGSIAFLSNLIFFFPVPESLIMPIGLLIAAFCLATFIGALIYPMAIVSNIIDLAHERTGKNLSGSYMGSMTMTTSLASACGIFIISIFLEWLGSENSLSFLSLYLLAGFLNLISYYFFKKVKTAKARK